MITIEQIKEQAESIIKLLKDVKTIEDCCNLRHYGIPEKNIFLELEDVTDKRVDYLADYLKEFQDWSMLPVKGIVILNYENLGDITYHFNDKQIFFDVYDKEYDPISPMLENATLETLEELYIEAVGIDER